MSIRGSIPQVHMRLMRTRAPGASPVGPSRRAIACEASNLDVAGPIARPFCSANRHDMHAAQRHDLVLILTSHARPCKRISQLALDAPASPCGVMLGRAPSPRTPSPWRGRAPAGPRSRRSSTRRPAACVGRCRRNRGRVPRVRRPDANGTMLLFSSSLARARAYRAPPGDISGWARARRQRLLGKVSGAARLGGTRENPGAEAQRWGPSDGRSVDRHARGRYYRKPETVPAAAAAVRSVGELGRLLPCQGRASVPAIAEVSGTVQRWEFS